MLTTPSRLVRIASAISGTADRRVRDYRFAVRRASGPQAVDMRPVVDSHPAVGKLAGVDSRRGDMHPAVDSREPVGTAVAGVAVDSRRVLGDIVPLVALVAGSDRVRLSNP